MLVNNTSLKYKTSHSGPFDIIQCWTNGTVTLQYGLIKICRNILCINPHISDTNVVDINLKLIIEYVTLLKYLLYTSVFY